MTMNRKYGGQAQCNEQYVLEEHFKYILEKISKKIDGSDKADLK
jgi:hypothetical protein